MAIDRLREAAAPVALALADPNDPLEHRGAVDGLVRLVREVPDVMLLRGDLAALGAVAYGATRGAFGTSTAVRHYVPPGTRAGGRAGDDTPSVFVPSLLAFKLGSTLDQLPHDAVPACDQPCCGGARLHRFNDRRTVTQARAHNVCAVQCVISSVLDGDAGSRADRFLSMCRDAVEATAALELAARRSISPSKQLLAWASLSQPG